jgi:hypothetical protein
VETASSAAGIRVGSRSGEGTRSKAMGDKGVMGDVPCPPFLFPRPAVGEVGIRRRLSLPSLREGELG